MSSTQTSQSERGWRAPKKKTYEQIEDNIEKFATLVDRIKNPLMMIVGLAELKADETSRKIVIQVRIDELITEFDEGWIESESVREFLKKHM